MNLKKWNEIFGYGLFIVGAFKMALAILILLQFGINMMATSNGGEINSTSYVTFFTIIGFAQIILAIGSIIMIILSIKKQPEVVSGYLWGLGPVLMELIVPSFLYFYFVFIECGMYMKAGIKIRNKNAGHDVSNSDIKRSVKNTEWFYGDIDKK